MSACVRCNRLVACTSPRAAPSNVDRSNSLPTVLAASINPCAFLYKVLAFSLVNPSRLSVSNLANEVLKPAAAASASICNVVI